MTNQALGCEVWKAPGATGDSPILYLLHGTEGRSSDWFEKGKIHETASDLHSKRLIPPMVLVGLPDGGPPGGPGTWYVNRADGKGQYEEGLVNHLIPEIEKSHGIRARRENRGIAGLSMGAWGAFLLGMRHPLLFGAVAGHSGVYNGLNLWTLLSEDIEELLGNEARIREHSPKHLISGLSTKEAPAFRLDCGAADALLPETKDMAAALRAAGLFVEEDELQGGHDWDYWKTSVRRTLLFMGRFLGARR